MIKLKSKTKNTSVIRGSRTFRDPRLLFGEGRGFPKAILSGMERRRRYMQNIENGYKEVDLSPSPSHCHF